jgi:hypothetical protein
LEKLHQQSPREAGCQQILHCSYVRQPRARPQPSRRRVTGAGRRETTGRHHGSTSLHIFLYISEQNLRHGSFSKISVTVLNRPLFHGDGSRRFHEPEENLVGG